MIATDVVEAEEASPPTEPAVTRRPKREAPTAFSQRVRHLRTLAGLSARETDRLAGISISHTSMIERGVGEGVSAKTVIAFARTFGVSLDWLLLGVGAEPTKEQVHAAIHIAQVHHYERAERPSRSHSF